MNYTSSSLSFISELIFLFNLLSSPLTFLLDFELLLLMSRLTFLVLLLSLLPYNESTTPSFLLLLFILHTSISFPSSASNTVSSNAEKWLKFPGIDYGIVFCVVRLKNLRKIRPLSSFSSHASNYLPFDRKKEYCITVLGNANLVFNRLLLELSFTLRLFLSYSVNSNVF